MVRVRKVLDDGPHDCPVDVAKERRECLRESLDGRAVRPVVDSNEWSRQAIVVLAWYIWIEDLVLARGRDPRALIVVVLPAKGTVDKEWPCHRERGSPLPRELDGVL